MSDELKWFKSSYSDPEGGACLEAALDWRKSTYSDGEGGACVEMATCTPTTVHIRDSKLPESPELTIPAPAWKAFISAVQPGA
ncbi:DUF397 domain-containing protein [Streptomyces sp. NBC_01381]|uniref:DUF397 domain-containing protein n=1 Tax=Streptomyces sp. NBC_01381 TaxID=2903845 RepID=UPI00225308E3|nr:DUF397 domain-containing protein [Streptomyces sp. NBC_01381]MCX4665520.1 DUF397 domain-containing protein [Streptomyces sp. NBC_01381]